MSDDNNKLVPVPEHTIDGYNDAHKAERASEWAGEERRANGRRREHLPVDVPQRKMFRREDDRTDKVFMCMRAKPGDNLVRCDRARGHDGLCPWELAERIHEFERQIQSLTNLLAEQNGK